MAIIYTFYSIMLMDLNRQKSELKCLNTLGRKLQIMEYYSCRRLIPLMALSSIGVTILKVDCFFHIDPQIPEAS